MLVHPFELRQIFVPNITAFLGMAVGVDVGVGVAVGVGVGVCPKT